MAHEYDEDAELLKKLDRAFGAQFGRGGKRRGAGRPKDPRSQRLAFNIRCSAEDRDRWRAAALLDPEGRTVSQVAREALDAWAEEMLG